MIVDTSALVAIIRAETDAGRYASALARAGEVRMSAGTYLETAIVVDRLSDPLLSRQFDEMIARTGTEIVPVTVQQAELARRAYRDFGKGSGHPARLNFGDCFSYALAADTREPLLFKGDDFVHTDLTPAVGSPT